MIARFLKCCFNTFYIAVTRNLPTYCVRRNTHPCCLNFPGFLFNVIVVLLLLFLILYYLSINIVFNVFLDIEAQILEIQGKKAALLEEGDQGVGLDSTGLFDKEIYGGSDSRFAGYVTSIAVNEQEDVSCLN